MWKSLAKYKEMGGLTTVIRGKLTEEHLRGIYIDNYDCAFARSFREKLNYNVKINVGGSDVILFDDEDCEVNVHFSDDMREESLRLAGKRGTLGFEWKLEVPSHFVP